MAITGQIPLASPGLEGLFQGANATSSLLSKMMQRRTAQEQMDRLRQMLPLDKQMKQAQINAANSSASMNPLRKLILGEQLKKLQHSNDPEYALKQLQSLMGYLNGLGGDEQQGGQVTPTSAADMPSYLPGIGKFFDQNQDNVQEPQQEQSQSSMPSVPQFPSISYRPDSFIPGVHDPMVGKSAPQQEQLKSFIQSLMSGQSQGQDKIPEINPNVVSEYDAAQSNQQPQRPKNPNGLNMDYIKQALTYKALGLPVPRQGAAGATTPEERLRNYEIRQKELDAKIAHNKVLEKNASYENKIALAEENARIKIEQKRLEGENKADIAYKEQLNKEEAKTFSKMENQAMKGIEEQPVMDGMVDLMSSPAFQSIRQHPNFPQSEIKYIQANGSPEQKKAVADLKVYGNQMVAAMAKGLNTRFTDKDLAFAQDSKISDKDSFEVARAKAESLVFLEKLGQKRLEKALEIARTQKKAPDVALRAADELVDGNKIRAAIHQQIYGAQQASKNPNDYVYLTDSDTGKREKMTRAEAQRRMAGK